jgi:sensor domain CHASE-containing protein
VDVSDAAADWLAGATSKLLAAMRPYLPSLIAAVPIVVASAWGYEALSQRQTRLIESAVSAEARWLQGEVRGDLVRKGEALEALATRWAGRPTTPDSLWQADADDLLRVDYQFRSILWMDPALAVRAVAPPTERLFGTLDPNDDELRRIALASALSTIGNAHATMTSAIMLQRGGREVLVAAPMTLGTERTGTIAATLRVRDLLDASLKRAFVRGLSVTVYEGPYHLFGPVWEKSGPEAQYASDADVIYGQLLWRLQVWPSEELAKKMESPAPLLVLGLGTLIALLVGWNVHQAGRAMSPKSSPEAANSASNPAGVGPGDPPPDQPPAA